MKNFKRKLALFILSLALITSCNSTVFAAEEEAINSIVSPKAVYSIDRLTPNYSGKGNPTATVTAPFTVSGYGSYLYFSYVSSWPVELTMYKSDVQVSSLYLLAAPDGGHAQIIFNHSPQDSFWAPGNYTVKAKFKSTYAFCVVGSPYILD